MFTSDNNPYYKRSTDDIKAMTSKGGKISAQRRKERADLKQACINVLQGCVTEESLVSMCKLYGIDPTGANAVALKQLQKAVVSGDTSAAIYLRDTSGQSPTAKTEISVDSLPNGTDLRMIPTDQLLKLIDNEE